MASTGYEVHNPARGKTVGQCVDLCWQVRIACENGHGGGWRAVELGAAFPREATLDAIAARLKCSVCGSTSGGLTILNDTGEAQRRDLERFNAKP